MSHEYLISIHPLLDLLSDYQERGFSIQILYEFPPPICATHSSCHNLELITHTFPIQKPHNNQ